MSYNPYANNVPAPSFELTLPEVSTSGALPDAAWATNADQSPAVRWGELPDGARSLLITALDPDAPIPGGFWHWMVKDVPAGTGGLDAGAGSSDQTLPAGATHLQGSMGQAAYAGVNPPPGTGTHRVFVCATALNVEQLPVPADAGAAQLHIAAIPHTLGRGIAIATSQAPSA